MGSMSRIGCLLGVLGLLCGGARADGLAPFYLPPDVPEMISLDGRIDARSALNFKRALAERPHASVLVLNSSGGLVQIALLIAEEVHDRGLATFIPPYATCASACAFIFLAGSVRMAEGALGVHQIYGGEPDARSLQYALSDVLELLDRYGTPREVIERMLRTPPQDMYYFSDEEKLALGLDDGEGAAAEELATGRDEEVADPENEVPEWSIETSVLLAAMKETFPSLHREWLDGIENMLKGGKPWGVNPLVRLRRQHAEVAFRSPDRALKEYFAAHVEAIEELRRRESWQTCNGYVVEDAATMARLFRRYHVAMEKIDAALLHALADGLKRNVAAPEPSPSDWERLEETYLRLGGTWAELMGMMESHSDNPDLCAATARYYKALIEVGGLGGKRVRMAALRDLAAR